MRIGMRHWVRPPEHCWQDPYGAGLGYLLYPAVKSAPWPSGEESNTLRFHERQASQRGGPTVGD